MGSFDVGQGGVNSGPDSYGVPDGVWADGPGFSLCATPLELFGHVFQDGRGDGMNERRSGVYRTRVLSVGIQTQWGTKGNIKEGLELTPMGSFNVGQRGHQLRTWLQLVCCTP